MIDVRDEPGAVPAVITGATAKRVVDLACAFIGDMRAQGGKIIAIGPVMISGEYSDDEDLDSLTYCMTVIYARPPREETA